MLIDYKLGQGSIKLRVKLRNSSVTTGAGLTGLTSASTGLIISTICDNEATAVGVYTVAGTTIETIATLGTYAAPTATKCRFREVDGTNHKGIYEIQIADARFATSGAKSILISISGATNLVECDVLIPLRTVDPYHIDFGLVKLDAAITTRMATFTYTAPDNTTIGLIYGKVDTELGTLQTDVTALPAAVNSALTTAHGAGSWVAIAASAIRAEMDSNSTKLSDILADTSSLVAGSEALVISGSVSDVSPTTSAFNGNSGLSSTDAVFGNSVRAMFLSFQSGLNAGHTRTVATYTGSTRRFTFTNAFPFTVANGDTFILEGIVETPA